jgi:hypothetical protein
MHMEMGGGAGRQGRGSRIAAFGLAVAITGCSSSQALYPLGFSDADTADAVGRSNASIRLVLDEPYRTYTSTQRGHWSATGQWYVVGPPLARLTAELFRRGFAETSIAWSAADPPTENASPAYTVHPRIREFVNDIRAQEPSQTLSISVEAEIRAPDGRSLGTVQGDGSDTRVLTSAFVWDYEIAIALRRAIEPALLELLQEAQELLGEEIAPLPAAPPAQSTADSRDLAEARQPRATEPDPMSGNLLRLAERGGTAFFSYYDRLLVENFTTVGELAPDTDADALEQALANFADYIANEAWACELFPAIRRRGVAAPRTLVISGSISGLVEGDSLKRALIGFGSGRSEFDTTILVRDGGTGAVLERFVMKSKSLWIGGMLASTQSTSGFMKSAADRIVSFLAAGRTGAALKPERPLPGVSETKPRAYRTPPSLASKCRNDLAELDTLPDL